VKFNKRNKKNILLLAYAVSPTRGSEYSVAWNYILEMSRQHRITILYGATGDHLGDIEDFEEYRGMFPLKNVRFYPIYPNCFARLLNWFNRRGKFIYTFYLAYNVWHRQVYRAAKKLIKEESFDLVHYLTPIGYREPGYLWQLDLPYIWGPIGGLQNTEPRLLKSWPFWERLRFVARSFLNTIQLHVSRRVKKAILRADVLLVATTEMKEKVTRVFGVKATYLPENGIINKVDVRKVAVKTNKVLNIIWVGRIDANKALGLLLNALTHVENLKRIHLDVIGEGILKDKLIAWAEKNAINEIITWRGHLTRDEVLMAFRKADVHIVTSCMEGNPTVIWESMSAGVPTVSLDHCGMHDVICERCGFRIPIKSYKQIVLDLAECIDGLVANPQRVRKLSENTLRCADNFTWEKRRDFFNFQYDIAIERYWKKKVRREIMHSVCWTK
jgi:glycosyltransferase involved in cell wall biosynthesis